MVNLKATYNQINQPLIFHCNVLHLSYQYIIRMLFVTGFMKTGPNHTRTGIHFIA